MRRRPRPHRVGGHLVAIALVACASGVVGSLPTHAAAAASAQPAAAASGQPAVAASGQPAAAVSAQPAVAASGQPGAQPAPTAYVAVGPVRLADTRRAGGFEVVDPQTVRVPVGGRSGVPPDATAVTLTVTVTDTRAPGFVTVYPAGHQRPVASNLAFETAGQTVANLVTVALGDAGAIELYVYSPAHVVVDLTGAFVPASTSGPGRFVPIVPTRAIDTRSAGGSLASGATVDVDLSDVPADASAAVVNVTVIAATAGYWSVYGSGIERPGTSTVNTDGPGQTRASLAVIPLFGQNRLRVFSQTGGQVVVDVSGWFTGASAPVSSDGLFVPVEPSRLVDTRVTSSLGDGKALRSGWTLEQTVGVTAAAVAVNLTATATRGAGYWTAYPAGVARPGTSSVNSPGIGVTVANAAFVAVGDRGLALFSQLGGHLVIDLAGWFTGGPVPSTQAVPVNPPLPTGYDETGHSLGPVAENEDDAPPVPADTGSGRRLVYSKPDQRAWAVAGDGHVVRSWLVSGSTFANDPAGQFRVVGKQAQSWGYGSYMRYFVYYYLTPSGNWEGFHELPTDTIGGPFIETIGQLGSRQSHGCIRQATPDALFVWDWASAGDLVVVTDRG